jgi:hypothetical protein
MQKAISLLGFGILIFLFSCEDTVEFTPPCETLAQTISQEAETRSIDEVRIYIGSGLSVFESTPRFEGCLVSVGSVNTEISFNLELLRSYYFRNIGDDDILYMYFVE